MKKLLLVLLSVVVLKGTTTAQWISDSVNMGPNITNDVFYSLGNSTVKTEGSANWILALSTSMSTAGIWANHSAGVRVFRTGKNVSQWNTITLADTALEQLFNPDTSWDYGALNAKSAAVYDYGWGTYNTVTHNVNGDSIFIVAQGNNFYQIAIDSMKGFTNDYYTRVAPVGSAMFTAPYVFKKAPKYSNSNFIYVKAGPMGLSDTTREPANNTWDVLFTKYITKIPDGAGGFVPYPVVGALSNRGTKTAKVTSVPVADLATTYASYPLNTTINNIGYDWKFFNGTIYTYPADQSYLVQSKDGSLWQMVFNGYSKATGVTNFNKRKLAFPAAINDVNNNATSFGVYPNPTNGTTLISITSKNKVDATLRIVDMQGKIVSNKNIQVQDGLNAFELNLSHLQAGNYLITLNGAALSANKLIIKQ
jgi:hypothetical protein